MDLTIATWMLAIVALPSLAMGFLVAILINKYLRKRSKEMKMVKIGVTMAFLSGLLFITALLINLEIAPTWVNWTLAIFWVVLLLAGITLATIGHLSLEKKKLTEPIYDNLKLRRQGK